MSWGAPSDFENNQEVYNLPLNPRGFPLLKFFSIVCGGKTQFKIFAIP